MPLLCSALLRGCASNQKTNLLALGCFCLCHLVMCRGGRREQQLLLLLLLLLPPPFAWKFTAGLAGCGWLVFITAVILGATSYVVVVLLTALVRTNSVRGVRHAHWSLFENPGSWNSNLLSTFVCIYRSRVLHFVVHYIAGCVLMIDLLQ
jgi:hypothetical protein